ncbi:MAG TPA: hypothetical protein VFB13_02085 [Reyranella sp.]|nr:hypothetical protein [Reyranella sp.]
MDVLIIHDEALSRVRLVKALQAASHRVTLSSSVEEASEMLQFARTKAEAPSVILIAEKLLGAASARLRQDLARRFDELLWIPLRHDLEAAWIARYLAGLELEAPAPKREKLNIVLYEPAHGLRRAMAGALTASGDTVVACASLKEAKTFLAGLGRSDDPWVLVAPVMCRGAELISLYLGARQCLPNLRWLVRAPQKTPARTGHATPRSTRLPDLEPDLETVRRRLSDPESQPAGRQP